MSKVELKASAMTYGFSSESGYEFTVDASLDPEYGWTATVTVASRGMRTAEAAVEGLEAPIKEFLRQLEEWNKEAAVAVTSQGKCGVCHRNGSWTTGLGIRCELHKLNKDLK